MRIIEDKLTNLRRIKYLLLKHKDIDIPDELLERANFEEIKQYLKMSIGVDSLTINELRDRAAILRITPIWGLTKTQLILAIIRKQDESCTCQKVSQ
jgi:hypothetical protein